jgi:hypothetical protein
MSTVHIRRKVFGSQKDIIGFNFFLIMGYTLSLLLDIMFGLHNEGSDVNEHVVIPHT